MFSPQLSWLVARQRERELREAARRAADPDSDSGETPVTRVTLRYASAADGARLRHLAQLDSQAAPTAPTLVAEVDGRLRAALPLDGSAAIADPFHRGAELIALLRMRAHQLGTVS